MQFRAEFKVALHIPHLLFMGLSLALSIPAMVRRSYTFARHLTIFVEKTL